MKTIGIYGGTFDPVHHGHLILAREALEQCEMDELVFIPAVVSPHKLDRSPTRPDLRLEMLRAAIAGEPGFTVDERELQRPPPSFTIDTMQDLGRELPGARFIYLIGSDNLPGLASWKQIGELEKLVEFVVLDRVSESAPSDYRTIHRPIEISATEIRNRVATGRSIQYLVPPAVEEIIRQHHLYQDTHR